MASKRALYKPVPEDKAAIRRNRRPLAQGRLVNTAAKPRPADSDAFHSLEQEQLTSSPRARLHSRVSRPPSDTRLTPRRITPKKSDDRLALFSEPSGVLDLSDSDLDHTEKGTLSRVKYNADQPSVLLVDAPHQSTDLSRSDVDTVTGYVQSPVKVICHSPRVRVGSGARGCRVPVDNVPRVIVRESELPPPVNLADHNTQSFDGTGREVKAGEHGAVISPSGRHVPHLPVSSNRYPQPNFDDSLKPQSPGNEGQLRQGGDHSDDQMSVVSNVSQTSSLREMLGSSASCPTSAKKSGTGKKKVRVISSRYMQSCDKFKAGGGSRQTSVNKSATSNRSVVRGSQSINKTVTKRKGSAKKSSSALSTAIQQTPLGSHQPHSTSGKTSTPTHEEVSFMHNIDASAITAENASTLSMSMFPGGDNHERAPAKKVTIERSKETQLDLDITYSGYLQWLYLDAAARKTLHDQEKCAMGQLNSLWEELESLRQTETQLRSELQQVKRANLLDEQLDLQSSGLSPVICKLPQLSSDHKLLAHALDTTRHQIPAQGVHLPMDQDSYQESLISALNESERLLGELSMLTRRHTPKVTEYSRAFHALEMAAGRESQLHRDCQGALTAAHSLTTAETCLKIQAIQAQRRLSVTAAGKPIRLQVPQLTVSFNKENKVAHTAKA
ncbi:uncharacterized protein LOC135467578 [Liolophura sinensis]|uniref:uncharacterized protein LOC135467578 n=1 Tax=Liolophura sinensis TaxID=3198878 RepID=UPI003158FCD3